MGYTFPKNEVIYAINTYAILQQFERLGRTVYYLNVCLHDVQDILKSIFASAFTFYNTVLWYSQFSLFLP